MPEIRRAAQRFHTVGDGIQTWHSFSYGVHYDPERIGLGALMAINTEYLAPGAGYDLHDHVDVEIVTWVLQGSLRHEDSTGQSGDVGPGTAQRLSAGRGVRHSERNASDAEPLVFVQMMLRSSYQGPPSYASVEVDPLPGVLTPTVSVHAPAGMFAVQLEAGQSTLMRVADCALLVVTGGTINVGDTSLGPGDEAQFTAAGEYDLSASSAATALIWQLRR